jgi:outer membrane protein OmpA-like peptidoglycan-associated protein
MAFAGIGAGAGVIAALFTLALIGLSNLGQGGAALAAPPWIKAITKELKGGNLGWMGIDLSDRVATVSGEAPDIDSQIYGFEKAEKLIKADPQGGDGMLVIDATTLKDGAPGVGVALKNLPAAPEAGQCSEAFTATLTGRAIQFELGSANISTESARLLDTLSAVAIRCKAYKIEIGGHTDLTGSPRRNEALSQTRAEAVRDYLIAKGVVREQLNAVGYGMSRPVVNARNEAADAQNRRIEFTVN